MASYPYIGYVIYFTVALQVLLFNRGKHVPTMNMSDKLVARARLIASGILRYHKFHLLSPKEVDESLEILAEELASLESPDEALTIRRDVELYGLQVPAVTEAVHRVNQDELESSESIGLFEGTQVCRTLKNIDTQGLGVHRAKGPAAQEQQNAVSSQPRGLCRVDTIAYTCEPGSDVIRYGVPTAEVPQQGPDQEKTRDVDAGLTAVNRCRNDRTLTAEVYEDFNPRGGTGSWSWRHWNYNRVPPAIEEAVRHKFDQGWSKSKLARAFRLNRRTIIRICGIDGQRTEKYGAAVHAVPGTDLLHE